MTLSTKTLSRRSVIAGIAGCRRRGNAGSFAVTRTLLPKLLESNNGPICGAVMPRKVNRVGAPKAQEARSGSRLPGLLWFTRIVGYNQDGRARLFWDAHCPLSPGHSGRGFFVGPVSIYRKRDGLNGSRERLSKTVVRFP